jgi:hypothetical protein
MTQSAQTQRQLDLAARFPAAVFIAALVTALPVWWLIAIPILTAGAAPFARHAAHLPWTYLHAAAGTMMLFTGAGALWIGWTRRQFRFHRWIGGTYLLTGLATATAALALNIRNVHNDANSAWATGALAAAWLVTAAMAFRAIRNRRIDSHRDWVIRSYVLTWSFVFCRGLAYLPFKLDAEAQGAALWLTWIVPLLLCEVALQWRGGARRA